MSNPVCWFDIYVEDLERARKFYESVLNIELGDLGDPSDQSIVMKSFPADMNKNGASGALVKMKGALVGQNSVIVYFACDDCSIEESRVESAGGKVVNPKYSIGDYGFISMAADTEGNMFGLHSMK